MNMIPLVLAAVLSGVAYRKRPVGLAVFWAIVVSIGIAFGNTGTTFILGTILSCLLLGQPLFVMMGLLSMGALWLSVGSHDFGMEVGIIVDKILELASKEVLLAIPFFVVAGEVMTQGSLAQRLIDVAKALCGWLPGGLAVAGVAGCVFFAAISGSSPVTVIAIGSIMVPALLKADYPEPFAMGLFTTAGSLGILIPPSIPMIVYSIMVGATTPMDPVDLFLAGVVPGALIGGMLAAYSVFVGVRFKLPTEKRSLGEIFAECRRGFWSLLLPVIILGGIYSGIFTATEAAAVSVVYALSVELFIHRELKFKDLPGVAENSMTVMGALFLIIALAIGLNHVLVLEQVPDRMVHWLATLDLDRTSFLLIVNLFLLLVGCFMDIMSAILIIAPMLAPMSMAMGIDPIHMGIIFIVNLEIGYCTPPVGLNLFVASTLFRRGLGEIIRAVLAPLGIMVVGLFLITWIPLLSTGLGKVLEGKPLFDEPVEDMQEQPDSPAPEDGTKTLQQLMQEQNGDADKAPKSLQELMQQQRDGTAAEQKPKSLQEIMAAQKAGAAAADQKPKSLQEIMAEQKAKAAAEAAEAAPPADKKPKSLQEIMAEQKAKAAAEAASAAAEAAAAEDKPDTPPLAPSEADKGRP